MVQTLQFPGKVVTVRYARPLRWSDVRVAGIEPPAKNADQLEHMRHA
jgi:hypothetical protein